MMLRRLMCGVGKKQIHSMSLGNELSVALQRTIVFANCQRIVEYCSLSGLRIYANKMGYTSIII